MSESVVNPLSRENVLLVAEYYPIGGTRTYVKQLLDFYHRMGAAVTLVTTLNDADPEIEALTSSFGYQLVTYAQVLHQSKFARPAVWSPLRFISERRAFREYVSQAGFTRIVVSAGTPGLLLGALDSLPNGIYILHTYPHGRRQELLARVYLSRLIPRTAQVVCVSHFQQDLVKRLWHTDSRHVPVLTLVNSCGPELPPRPVPSTPWQVLTVSMVEDYKQPLQWVRVAVEVSQILGRDNVRFVWVGDGTQLDAARRSAESFASLAHIEFVGSRLSAQDYYESSHLYFQYSSIENMSLAVIDALRHGLPCVVTETGGLPEIVDNAVTGRVISPLDESVAAEEIASILCGEKQLSSWAQDAKLRYKLKFSQSRWEEDLLAIHSTR